MLFRLGIFKVEILDFLAPWVSNRFTVYPVLLALLLLCCLFQSIQCFINTRDGGKNYVCGDVFRVMLDEQYLSFERCVHLRVYMASGRVLNIDGLTSAYSI